MRLFVLQNGLESRATHYFNESLAWREVCRARSIALRLYANRKAAGEVAEALDATPCFTLGPDDAVRFEPETPALHGLVHKSDLFVRECGLLLAHGIGPDDVLVLPYGAADEILGLARWLATRPRPKRPRVAVVMHRPPDGWLFDDDQVRMVEGDALPLRYAVQRLARAAGADRMVLAATTGRLAEILGEATGVAATPLTVMLRYPRAAASVPDNYPTIDGRSFDIGVLGQFRPEKGSGLAVDVLARVCDERPGTEVLLQVDDAAQAEAVRAQWGERSGLTLAVGQLASETFEDAVGACRLLLLPYRANRYVARTSGLCAEAGAWGRPIVGPARSWPGDMVEAGRVAGRLFGRFHPDVVRAALVAALDDLEPLAARAAAVAPAWRASECIETGVGRMLEALGLG